MTDVEFQFNIPSEIPSHSEFQVKSSFSGGAWEQNDQALALLMSRIKSGEKSCHEVMQFLAARSLAEDEYVSRLKRISLTNMMQQETGTMRNTLNTLVNEVTTTLDIHSKLAAELKSHEQNVQIFAETQRMTRKEYESTLSSIVKTRREHFNAVAKKKDVYMSRLREIETLNAHIATAPNPEKVKARIVKIERFLKKAGLDYQSGIIKLNIVSKQWKSQFEHLCDDFEKLEILRIRYLCRKIKEYTETLSQAHTADVESCLRIRAAIEKCDPAVDIETFLQSCHLRSGAAMLKHPQQKVPLVSDSPFASPRPAPLNGRSTYTNSNDENTAPAAQRTVERSLSSQEHSRAISQPQLPELGLQRAYTTPLLTSNETAAVATTPPTSLDDRQLMYDRQIVDDISATQQWLAQSDEGHSQQRLIDSQSPSPPRLPSPTYDREPKLMGDRGNTDQDLLSRQQRQRSPSPPDTSESTTTSKGEQLRSASAQAYITTGSEAPSPPFRVRVLYDYTSKCEGEMDISVGDVIAVHATEHHPWWEGTIIASSRQNCINTSGAFPYNYVQVWATPMATSRSLPSETITSSALDTRSARSQPPKAWKRIFGGK